MVEIFISASGAATEGRIGASLSIGGGKGEERAAIGGGGRGRVGGGVGGQGVGGGGGGVVGGVGGRGGGGGGGGGGRIGVVGGGGGVEGGVHLTMAALQQQLKEKTQRSSQLEALTQETS